MANQEHVERLKQRAQAWNDWRARNPNTAPDLSGADLRGANLESFNLTNANLAGTNLSGATLPEPLTKIYEKLEAVANISESARKLFVALLAACLYSWLTIATTTDLNLITNRASSPLPIIRTSIPVVGFYWVAPLLLLCVYFYFHFYLQKLWDELGSLPAIFPDGRCLHERSDPWLLNDLVRAHVQSLKGGRPFLSYFQQIISIVLTWWLVPVTLIAFWFRYLPRHGSYVTGLHVTLIAISVMAALCLYGLAGRTLQGVRRAPFSLRWRPSPEGRAAIVAFVGIGALFCLPSFAALWGIPSDTQWQCPPLKTREPNPNNLPRPYNWLQLAMERLRFSPFADLQDTDFSVKPPTWSSNWVLNTGKQIQFVVGARLPGAHLQRANLIHAFLLKANLAEAHLDLADLSCTNLRSVDRSCSDLRLADLSGAHLSGANLNSALLGSAKFQHAQLMGADLTDSNMNYAALTEANLGGAKLSRADLRWADFTRADLAGAVLTGAKLAAARLKKADLNGADLTGADLTFTDFRSYSLPTSTRGLRPEQLKSARSWEKAYYDADILQSLGLPPDHNDKLAEQQRKEEEEQRKKYAQSARP